MMFYVGGTSTIRICNAKCAREARGIKTNNRKQGK
jgi:hypothetical protein